MSVTQDTDRISPPAVGAGQPNIEWADKTTGRARYSDDFRPEGLLHAAVHRSPHPHARIVSIDSSRVRSAPGVVAVITHQDLRTDRNYIHHGHHLADRTVLARDVVRFIGEEVAAVAAETPAQALAAAALFDVRYERLTELTSVTAALGPGAPLIHEGSDGNVALAFTQDFGPRSDVAGAVSVSGSFSFPRQNHACMETNSIVAHWVEEAQELHVWVSTQAPYFVEKELSHVLGLERDQVVVHEVAVGGGFGSKSKIGEYEAVAATLSIQSGRPVRLALTRDEEFTTVKSRHHFDISMTTTAGPDGLLLTRDADVVVENGAFNHSGPSVMGAGTGAMISLYRVPSVHVDAKLVYTNRLPGGQFRGYGNPQATFAVESQMDELAHRLGMDPFEFRIRNANRAGDRTHAGYQLDSAALVECLEAARDAIGWPDKRSWAGSGRGVGVAAGIQVSGAYVYPEANKSSAGLELGDDGEVLLRFGGADAGTGQRTVLAQVVADQLGVPVQRVDVTMMDSQRTPQDLGAWSSRGTYMSAHAAIGACRLALDELRERAAGLFDVAPDAVEVDGGRFHAHGDVLDVAQVLAATTASGPVKVEHEFTAHVEEMDWATGTGNISGAYSFAAHAVEVEVDRRTGKVKVVDYVAAHDSGQVINPLLADSQVVGGVVMGLGAALGEELIFEGGRMVNPSYLNYPLPRAADVPRIRPLFVAASDPNGPLGAKGVGEIVLVPTVAAVGNAIAHATGARVRHAPFTPDKVLTGWAEARGERRSRRYHLWRRPDRWQIAAVRAAYPRGLHSLLDRYGTRLAKDTEAPPVSDIVEPRDHGDALRELARPDARPIGGGTDLVPGQREGQQALGNLVDVTLLPGMGRVVEEPDGAVRIGGAVRLSTLAEGTGSDWRGALGETARRIASHQVREMATVAGNLCQEKRCWFYRNDFTCYKRGGTTCPCYAVNGDHRFFHAVSGAHRCQAVTPSDLATTLLAMDAEVVVTRHQSAERRLSVDELYSGPGETTLGEGDLISSVRLSAESARRQYSFAKLDLWAGDFAVVSAAAGVRRDEQGRLVDARLVLGAVAPTPLRLTRLERRLVASPPRNAAGLDSLCSTWGSRAHPLEGNEWKVDAAAGVLAQALAPLLGVDLD